MADDVTLIRVFVSSPEDLRADREFVAEAAEELNRTSCLDRGVRLEVFSWRTAGSPDFGPDPQAVLSQQLNDFDVYVGLMGHTFGSPTPRGGSGTEEEFTLAYQRWKTDHRSCRLMFYFNEAPVAPSNIDPKQLHRVREFRVKLGQLGGLYWTYSNASGELPTLLRQHLFWAIRDYGSVWGPQCNTPADPLAGRREFDNQKGQLDFAMDAEGSFRATTRALATIGASIVQMGNEIRQATQHMMTLRDSGALTASAAQREAGAVASAVLAMVVRMDVELPVMIQGWTAFRENVLLALGSAAAPEAQVEKEDLRGLAAFLKAGRQPLLDARAGVSEMRIELRKVANLSRDLRHAEGRANASFAALITEIDRELTDLGQIESAILSKIGMT